MYSHIPLAVYMRDAVSVELAAHTLICLCPGGTIADQQVWTVCVCVSAAQPAGSDDLRSEPEFSTLASSTP